MLNWKQKLLDSMGSLQICDQKMATLPSTEASERYFSFGSRYASLIWIDKNFVYETQLKSLGEVNQAI